MSTSNTSMIKINNKVVTLQNLSLQNAQNIESEKGGALEIYNNADSSIKLENLVIKNNKSKNIWRWHILRKQLHCIIRDKRCNYKRKNTLGDYGPRGVESMLKET